MNFNVNNMNKKEEVNIEARERNKDKTAKQKQSRIQKLMLLRHKNTSNHNVINKLRNSEFFDRDRNKKVRWK